MNFGFNFIRRFSSCQIKNLDKKSCVNCLRFIETTQSSLFGRCHKFGEKNLVSGDLDYSLASICRKNKNQCGVDAKFFLSKHLYKVDKIPLK
jgi:hypothetical protein